MADQGHGIAVAFDGGFFAEVLGAQWSGLERGEVPTTHSGTTVAKTNAPAELYDPGELEVELHFDPDTTPAIIAGDVPETCTVTFTDAAGTTWAASGWMKSFAIDASEDEERVKATAVIRFSGPITIV